MGADKGQEVSHLLWDDIFVQQALQPCNPEATDCGDVVEVHAELSLRILPIVCGSDCDWTKM